MDAPHRSRLMALVGALAGERRATQTAGYPLDPSAMLPVADVVLIVSEPGEGAMLFRYTAHGDLAGDTWHATTADALEQASDEYADALGPWLEVPDEIGDAHAFAVRYAYERLDSRGGW
jgi:hypothetical protein